MWYPPLPNDTHHPAANVLVGSLHRNLKHAIMCHVDEKWTEALPLVLLVLRIAYKENMQSSAVELVMAIPCGFPASSLSLPTRKS